MTATWRLAVDPMPWIRVVELSVSTKPYRVVHLFRVWTTDTDAIVDKPLKHVIDVIICDDRQCGVPARAKPPRFIPIQHRAVCVEAILLTVHWVARADRWYDIYGVQQNQNISYKAYVVIDTQRFTCVDDFIVTIITIIIIIIIIEAQLSQRDPATLRVIEYFAKSLKVTEGHSQWHPWVGSV